TAAFMLLDRIRCGRRLGRRDDRGPIFHAKTSGRKDRGAMYGMRHACPHRSGQNYLMDFNPDFPPTQQENVIGITTSIRKLTSIMRKLFGSSGWMRPCGLPFAIFAGTQL